MKPVDVRRCRRWCGRHASRMAGRTWEWLPPLPHGVTAAAAEPPVVKSACRPRSATSASHLCQCVAVAMTCFGKRLRHPCRALTPPAVRRGGDGATRILSRFPLPWPLAAKSADIRPLFHHRPYPPRPLVALAAARHSIPNMPRCRTCLPNPPHPSLRLHSPRGDPSPFRCCGPTESPSPRRRIARVDSTFAAGVRVLFGSSGCHHGHTRVTRLSLGIGHSEDHPGL